MDKRILITGVNGSMGRALAQHLVSLGYIVYGSMRKHYMDIQLPIDRDKIIIIDFSIEEEYLLPADLDAIIHCAAVTSEVNSDRTLSRKVNVEGMGRLIAASKKANTKRLIFISTMSANLNNPSAYAQTKVEAEMMLMNTRGLDYVILRPGLVISNASRGIFSKMINFVDKLPIIPIIGNNANLATISVTDLCKAVELTIKHPNVSGLKIDVCANESLSIKQIVKIIAKASGRNVLCITIPYKGALLIAKATNLVKLRLLTKDNVYGLQYARAAETTNLNKVLGLEAERFESTINKYMHERRAHI